MSQFEIALHRRVSELEEEVRALKAERTVTRTVGALVTRAAQRGYVTKVMSTND
jgi:hypothetical protein